MALIDIGSAAIDRSDYFSPDKVIIAKENPANDSGIITSIEIWSYLVGLSNCKVGIFYSTGTNQFSTRSYTTLGTVNPNNKQTFSGLSLPCQAGDYIGIYFYTGLLRASTTSGEGAWNTAGDVIPCTNQVFTFTTNSTLSLYAKGTSTSSNKTNALFFGMNF